MASDESFVTFVLEQMAGAGPLRARKMFGEYAIYCQEKVVALVCDNRLLVKPTPEGRAYIGDVVEEPPYPGAKPSFLIGEGLEDPDWLGELIRLTARALPVPAPKRPRKRKPGVG